MKTIRHKKNLAMSSKLINNKTVVAKSATGIQAPFNTEVQHASNAFLDTCVFFCACFLPIMAGRFGLPSGRPFPVCGSLNPNQTRHPNEIQASCVAFKNPNTQETANV